MSDTWEWLESTRELQKLHGYDLPFLKSEDLARADFLAWNFLAASDELHEALREVDWKPWSKGRGRVNADGVLEEVVDLMHFLANILCAVGVSEDELWDAYRTKQEENFRRVREGYTARLGT